MNSNTPYTDERARLKQFSTQFFTTLRTYVQDIYIRKGQRLDRGIHAALQEENIPQEIATPFEFQEARGTGPLHCKNLPYMIEEAKRNTILIPGKDKEGEYLHYLLTHQEAQSNLAGKQPYNRQGMHNLTSKVATYLDRLPTRR
jgi:hypothetical protein